jgi:hypothetical protein
VAEFIEEYRPALEALAIAQKQLDLAKHSVKEHGK